MHVLINGEDMGVAATDVPRSVYAILDIYGRVESVGITSSVPTDSLTTRKGKNQACARNLHLQSARDRAVEPPEIVVAPSEGVVDPEEPGSPLGAMAPPLVEAISDKVLIDFGVRLIQKITVLIDNISVVFSSAYYRPLSGAVRQYLLSLILLECRESCDVSVSIYEDLFLALSVILGNVVCLVQCFESCNISVLRSMTTFHLTRLRSTRPTSAI